MKASKVFNVVVSVIVAVAMISTGFWVHGWIQSDRMLREIIDRFAADTRVAQVLVTKSEFDEKTEKIQTTIKFLEFDTKGEPLKPKYFTFSGNLIQFQSLVIRFQDDFVKKADKLRGKSVFLFLKAFVLDGDKSQVFEISKHHEIPEGYRVDQKGSKSEQKLWQSFWDYALQPEKAKEEGIKNAQIEAPGTMFLPGSIYTIHIEHDGGLRIDSQPIPAILQNEPLMSYYSAQELVLMNIVVFGGSHFTEESPEYTQARELGSLIAKEGWSVSNGGYAGIMEASSRGAHEESGNVYGVMTEDFSRNVNPYVSEIVKAGSWRDRLFQLMDRGDAYVLCDGATGTLVELFVAWEMSVKKKIKKPIVVLGTRLQGLLTYLEQMDIFPSDVIFCASSPQETLTHLKTVLSS